MTRGWSQASLVSLSPLSYSLTANGLHTLRFPHRARPSHRRTSYQGRSIAFISHRSIKLTKLTTRMTARNTSGLNRPRFRTITTRMTEPNTLHLKRSEAHNEQFRRYKSSRYRNVGIRTIRHEESERGRTGRKHEDDRSGRSHSKEKRRPRSKANSHSTSADGA